MGSRQKFVAAVRSFLTAGIVGIFFMGGAWAQTPSLTGFWWKPTESGWGVAVQQQGNITFAVWFTYDAQSVPTWYTLQCTFSGTTCSGTLATATGK